MKNTLRRFCASVLAVVLIASMLGSYAYAEEFPQSNEPSDNSINTASDISKTPDSNVPNSDAESTQSDSISNGEAGESDSVPVITVDGVEISDSEVNSGWNGGYGWRYDTKSVSILGNSTPIAIHAENTGVDLSVAGFSRISTLYADGDVNITGTGILLVDNIDMLEGTNINLLTNTDIYEDGTGSVALFVYNADDDTYYLKNGDVTGILDETITIPAGINLYIPSSSKLEVRVLDRVYEKDNESPSNDGGLFIPEFTKETRYSFVHYGVSETDSLNENLMVESTTPTLTISSGSTLTIAEGANLTVDATDKPNAKWVDMDKISSVAKVIVDGVLNLFGKIIGVRNNEMVPELRVKDNGNVQGTGTIEDIDIRYLTENTDDVINVAGDTIIVVSGNGLNINAGGGNTNIIFEDGAIVNNINISSADAGIEFLTKEINSVINVNGTDEDTLKNISAPTDSVMKNGSLIGYDIEQAKSTTAARAGKEEWAVPVTTELLDADTYDWSLYKIEYSTAYTSVEGKSSLTLTPGNIGYQDLKGLVVPSEIQQIPEKSKIVYRLVILSDGKVVPVYLDSHSECTCNTADILSVSVVYQDYTNHRKPDGGVLSGVSSLQGGSTGSGILGGENAGSFSGGSSTSILSGSRKPSSNTPETDPAPNIPAEPAPDDPSSSTSPEDVSMDIEKNQTAAAAASLTYSISGTGGKYTLEAFMDGNRITDISSFDLAVAFRVDLPSEYANRSLFVVFYKDNGEISVIRAHYSALTGVLSFNTSELGPFSIIALDWDGTDLCSAEFLSAVRNALAEQ